MSHSIGLILPQSNFLSHLAKDIPKAIKLGLGDFESDIDLKLIAGGFNADSKKLVEKTQDLVINEHLDLLLAPLNTALIESLNALCIDEEIPLIINTMGEDVVFPSAISPNVFINSLHLWQTAWLTGYHCAKSITEQKTGDENSKIAAMHCFHDGGYGTSFALALGIEAAGGETHHAEVTHRESRNEDCTIAIESTINSQSDAIIANYASKEAVHFLQTYLSKQTKTKLMAMPYTVEENILSQLQMTESCGIQSISAINHQTQLYQKLSADFLAATNHKLNPYTLMAYETGRLIKQAIQNQQSTSYSDRLIALTNAVIEGPRGSTAFNTEQAQNPSQQYLREVVYTDNKYHNSILTACETPDIFYQQYQMAQDRITKQGWLNPYLIA